MIITVDRDSGIFDKVTSDQINLMSTDVYTRITSLPAPTLAYKEEVHDDYFNGLPRVAFRRLYSGGLYVDHFYDCSKDVVTSSFTIGKLHIVNISIKPIFLETVPSPGWSGNIPSPTLVSNSLTTIGISSQLPTQDVWAFDQYTIANVSPLDATIKVQCITNVDTISLSTYFIR